MTIWTPFKLPARGPVWIAGITVCLLAASGVVAVIRSIPASYANIPDKNAASAHAAVPSLPAHASSYSYDSQAAPPRPLATINRRNRTSCPECGVIESMRQIERSGAHDTLDVKVARRVSGDAIASSAVTGKRYEITVRFRDGSTTVFNQAGPQALRPGNRVIVIGGSRASSG
jgi:hypothetical protein